MRWTGIALALCLAGVGLTACDGDPMDADAGDEGTDAGAVPPGTDAGPPPAGTDAGPAPTDAGPSCPAPPGPPEVTGATHELRPGGSLEDLVAGAAGGDEIVVYEGSYGDADIRDVAFTDPLIIRAAPGETATFGSFRLERADGLYVEGLTMTGTVTVQSGDGIVFDGIDVDVGDIGGAAFHVRGRGADLGSHEVTLRRSTIAGGQRTVFLHSLFTPPDEWNQDLHLHDNDFACFERNCVQISGARGVVIEDNVFHDAQGDGIIMAGAIDVEVRRNRFLGASGGASGGAVRVATPGVEWDDFDGVRHMVSEDVVIANNLMVGFAHGVGLNAARRVDIVFNTVVDGRGLYTWHRTPHDRSGAVILTGNSEYRAWNNLFGDEVEIDGRDPRPMLESNNATASGGMGPGLVTEDPMVSADGSLAAGSPLLDAALVHEDNPAVDLDGRDRVGAPDIGAVEDGAMSSCP